MITRMVVAAMTLLIEGAVRLVDEFSPSGPVRPHHPGCVTLPTAIGRVSQPQTVGGDRIPHWIPVLVEVSGHVELIASV